MKVFVSGGAGFIGSHLVKHLVGRGFSVSAMDALRPYAWPAASSVETRDLAYRRGLLADVQLIKGDLCDRKQTAAALAATQAEIVIHLAANPLVGAAEQDCAASRADIVASTSSLLAAAGSAACVRRIVHVSSSMVYGDFPEPQIDETAHTAPVNAYGRLKLEAEELVTRHSDETGTQFAIVRPMAVYGPGDMYSRLIPTFCARARQGLPLRVIDGADTRADFSHVDDIVDGIVRAALLPAAANQVFNLTSGMARTIDDLTEILRSHFPALRCEKVTADSKVRPARGGLNIDKAKDLLGFEPHVTLEDGVQRCVAFYDAA